MNGRKELIMMTNNISNLNRKSVMGSYYFGYFKACYFAGLFRRSFIPSLSVS